MAMQYNPASCFCVSSNVSTLVAVTDATRDDDSHRSEEKGIKLYTTAVMLCRDLCHLLSDIRVLK
jgi:hypothetical protein